jgi:ABC-2 type transport system permease protein
MSAAPSALRRFVANVVAVAWKEAAIMRHDAAFIGMVVAQPIMTLALFGAAITMIPANVPWSVLDRDGSALSRRFVEEVQSTGYFAPPVSVSSYEEGRARLARGQDALLVVIPEDFRREALRGRPEVQALTDGTDPLTAARVAGYVALVAQRFETGPVARSRRDEPGPLELRQQFRFNPTLDDQRFYLAAIAGLLLTNLCLSVTSLGLVGERESGTYEQMLAQPTSPLEIVLGKLVPYAAMSYVVLGIATLGAGLVFGVWPNGSPLALLAVTLPFVLASLSIGVFVSTVARTSAQAVFITVFFILPSFVLSGVMLPYQLMPDGIRHLGFALPLRWYQIGLRRVVLRGGDMGDVAVPMLALTVIFAVLLAVIARRLRPRLD